MIYSHLVALPHICHQHLLGHLYKVKNYKYGSSYYVVDHIAIYQRSTHIDTIRLLRILQIGSACNHVQWRDQLWQWGTTMAAVHGPGTIGGAVFGPAELLAARTTYGMTGHQFFIRTITS